MSQASRRSFLAVAGSGAVTTAVVAAAPSSRAASSSSASSSRPRSASTQPLVAHVRDAAAGTVVLYVGHDEVVVHDPDLVRRLTRRGEEMTMSSHREAPEISKDPVADNTDVYAFVSPDQPDTVTLIANFIPFQNPQGGPNFYEFGDDVALRDPRQQPRRRPTPTSTYQFRFTTKVRNADTFLYNTGPITSIDDPTWNRPQFYSVTRVARGDRQPRRARPRT